MEYLYLYIVAINITTFWMFAADKKRARKKVWRIPESRLLFFSLIGGSLGGILAMITVHHKTKKLLFTIGMPVLLVINIFVLYYLKK